MGITVTRVDDATLTGSVFCPRCGWRLGRADSPALPYLKRCSNCDRALAIRIDGETIVIATEDPGAVGH